MLEKEGKRGLNNTVPCLLIGHPLLGTALRALLAAFRSISNSVLIPTLQAKKWRCRGGSSDLPEVMSL